MIGLDTSAIIDLFRGNKNVTRVINKNEVQYYSTYLNYAEIMFGIDCKNNKREVNEFDMFFNDIKVLNFSPDAIKKASIIFQQLKKEGKQVGKFDCMIAGIFLSEGVKKIITANVKHFDRIRGLKVIGYDYS